MANNTAQTKPIEIDGVSAKSKASESNEKTLKVNKNKQIFSNMLRMLSYAFNKQPALTVALIVFIALGTLTPLATRWIGSKLLDELIGLIGQTDKLNKNIIILVIWLLIITVVQDIVTRVRTLLERNLDNQIGENLERDVIMKLAYLDAEYFDRPKINDLINRVKSKYNHEPYRFLYIAFIIFEEIIKISVNLTVLITLSPLIILIAVVSIIPDVMSNAVYGKKIWATFNLYSEQRRDTGMTQGYLMNEDSIKELKTFRIRRFMFERFNRLKMEWVHTQISLQNKRDIVSGLWGLFKTAGHGINIIILVAKTLAGALTIGLFNFYWGTITTLESSIERLFKRAVEIQERARYVSEIFEFLDIPVKVINGTKHLANTTKPPLIKFDNVSYKYPETEKYVIKDFNLEIKPGEHIAIVGENGAGKSTLIKLLMRFYDIDEGSIVVDGNNIKDLDLDNWYKTVGTLFQNYNFYHFDAKTNISVGNIELADNMEKIVEAAKASDADSFIRKYDNKYDQILSKSLSGGINPSIGQMQKIALARAFFKDAPVLILDEPTSAIDPKAEFEIFEKLFEFAKDKTVIIISHRFSTVRNAQRIIVLNDGKIAEEGSHDELMQIENGKYKTAFELQRKGYQ